MIEEVEVCFTCARSFSVYCVCKNPPLALCDECSWEHQLHFAGVHFPVRKARINSVSYWDWCGQARRIASKVKTAESCLEFSEQSALDCFTYLDQQCFLAEKCDLYAAIRVSLYSQFTEFKDSAQVAINDLKQGLLKPTFSSSNALALQIYQYEGKPRSCLVWWKAEDSVEFRIEYPRNSETTKERCVSEVEGKGVDLMYAQCWYKYQPLQGNFVTKRCVGTHQLRWPLTISLGDEGVCCIGDCHYYGASASVYLVSSAGECRAICPLLAARGSPGAVALHRFVYVLGGVSSAGGLQSSSERLHLDSASLHWEPIPPLTEARKSFTPCTYQHAIYICGGWGTRGCEVLDTRTLKYELIALKLQEESDTLSACVGEGEIWIITKSHFVTWDAQLNSTICRQSHDPQLCIYSSSGATVLGRKVYFAGFGSVTVVDFDSGDFQREFLDDGEDR